MTSKTCPVGCGSHSGQASFRAHALHHTTLASLGPKWAKHRRISVREMHNRCCGVCHEADLAGTGQWPPSAACLWVPTDAAPSTPPSTAVAGEGISRTVGDLTPSKTAPPNKWPDELREAAMKKESEDLMQILFQEGKYNADDQASLQTLCKANVLDECAVSVKMRMREIKAEDRISKKFKTVDDATRQVFGSVGRYHSCWVGGMSSLRQIL